jgi:hypothetical protein
VVGAFSDWSVIAIVAFVCYAYFIGYTFGDLFPPYHIPKCYHIVKSER